jgi:hypothetical protein
MKAQAIYTFVRWMNVRFAQQGKPAKATPDAIFLAATMDDEGNPNVTLARHAIAGFHNSGIVPSWVSRFILEATTI